MKWKKRWRNLLAGDEAAEPNLATISRSIDTLSDRLASLEQRLGKMDYFSNGARATYVGDRRVLMKCVVADAQIAFLVESDDKLLAPWFIVSGQYETEVTNYFVRALAPDSRCVDIGSNFGYFTCLMARFCPQGRIVGVEADERIFQLARDNIFINGFNDRAEMIWAAAADAAGEMTLHRRGTRSGNTSMARLPADYIKRLGEPESQSFTVETVTLDAIAERMGGRIDFVKIDVEGAEPLVFKGAKAALDANPDLRIVMEWSPGQIVAAGFAIDRFLADIEALGLRAFDIGQQDPLALTALTMSELAALPYRAGVVLMRG